MKAALLALLSLPATEARAQSGWFDEVRVGSERELYVRVLGLVSGASTAWTIRPFSPSQSSTPATPVNGVNPWAASEGASGNGRVRVLRPAIKSSANASFPWQAVDAPSWQGKGLNATATAGGAFDYGMLSARIEPSVGYASNYPFALLNAAVGFADPVTPGSIDHPQRFGSSSIALFDAGETFVRATVRGVAAGLSNERIFWGPGVRHALLFGAQAPGFPHAFVGTSKPWATPIGHVHGQLLYGRLDKSQWAPPSPTRLRFGSGVIGTWTPPSSPLTFGVARFYHREWPRSFNGKDFFAPFGSIFFDPEVAAGDVPDNQLATGFFSMQLARARIELFGEFGRNDRNVDTRDLSLEPEHNSAWLIGALKAFAVDSASQSFWSARYEAASGRISSIQGIRREQSLFFEHATITQGHTHRGLLLGTPLIEGSGGFEFALDRWTSSGRLGFALLERQMPPDIGVGMPGDQARTQWDLKLSGLRFVGLSELTWQLGHVWDLNRFPNRDAGNLYLGVGWRQALPR